MPRRNRNALRYRKPRARKHSRVVGGRRRRKLDERSAPLTPGQFHSAPRMRPR